MPYFLIKPELAHAVEKVSKILMFVDIIFLHKNLIYRLFFYVGNHSHWLHPIAYLSARNFAPF